MLTQTGRGLFQCCVNADWTRPVSVGFFTYVDPGLVHELGDGHPFVRVRLQQLMDQIFGWKNQGEGNIKRKAVQNIFNSRYPYTHTHTHYHPIMDVRWSHKSPMVLPAAVLSSALLPLNVPQLRLFYIVLNLIVSYYPIIYSSKESFIFWGARNTSH